jgi:Cdc6-like AAA superfamily ATPase
VGGANNANFRNHDRNKEKRHGGSGSWLFGEKPHELFVEWTEGRMKPPILWLHAKPGTGKSVLCSAAIERLRSAQYNAITAFLLLRFDQPAQSLQLFRTLADQLLHLFFQQSAQIPNEIVALLSRNRDDSASVKELIQFLLTRMKPVYIFLDGLDELEEDIKDFLSFIVTMAKDSGGTLRLWCSSQPRSSIKMALKGCHELEIDATHVECDIRAYLTSYIPDAIEEENQILTTTVYKAVSERAEGSFLWASCMVDWIGDAESPAERIKKIKEGFPDDINTYYKRILDRLSEKDDGKLSR